MDQNDSIDKAKYIQDLLDERVDGEDVGHRGEARGKKLRQINESKRLIRKVLETGVPGRILKNVKSTLDMDKYVKEDLDEESSGLLDMQQINQYIWGSYNIWANSATNIFIEGGSAVSRVEYASICMYRGVIAHHRKRQIRLGCFVEYELLLQDFKSYKHDKIQIVENLRKVPLLCLTGLDSFRSSNHNDPYSDGGRLFDSIINGRQVAQLPTIYTVNKGCTSFCSGDKWGATCPALVDIIDQEPEFENEISKNGIIKVQLK